MEVQYREEVTVGHGRVKLESQRTLSPNGHLMVILGAAGLLLLIKWTSKSISIFNWAPLVDPTKILLFAFLIYVYTSTLLAERLIVQRISTDNSKLQHITINTNK